MTNVILRGNPNAGMPCIRFDEEEAASTKLRHGALLGNKRPNGKWGRLAIAGLLSWGVLAAAFGVEVSAEQARRALANWRARTQPLGLAMGERVSGVRTVTGRGVSFHVVRFEGGGFALAPTDDTIRPVILFSDGSDFNEDAANPMWDLLANDLAVASPGRKLMSATPVLSEGAKANQNEWRALTREVVEADSATPSIDDVRVAPIVQSRWDQENSAGYYCWNYYTANQYPCGCTATAVGQVARQLEYPTGEVEGFTSTISVNGKATEVTVAATTFNWALMPYNPRETTEANKDGAHGWDERRAIGRLVYNIGAFMESDYRSSGTAASPCGMKYALTDYLGYASAQIIPSRSDRTTTPAEFERALLSNFDAKLPVLISIGNDSSSKHAIVGDGYGYNNGRLYYHLNMGWGDQTSNANCWYRPPSSDETVHYSTYTLFHGMIYNIFTNMSANTVIASGRVTNDQGVPQRNVEVKAMKGDLSVAEVRTDEKGIYAFFLEPGQDYTFTVDADFANGRGHRRGSIQVNPTACRSATVYGASSYDWDEAADAQVGNAPKCDITVATTYEGGLAAGYEALPYVEVLGGANAAYVNTGVQSVKVSFSDDQPVMEVELLPTATTPNRDTWFFGALNTASTAGGSLALGILPGSDNFRASFSYATKDDAKNKSMDMDCASVAGKPYTVTFHGEYTWGQVHVLTENGLYNKYFNLGNGSSGSYPNHGSVLESPICIGRASYVGGVANGAAARYYSAVLSYGAGARTTFTYCPAVETATGKAGFYCLESDTFLPNQGSTDFGYLRGTLENGTLTVRDGVLAAGYSYLGTDAALGIGAFASVVKTGASGTLRIRGDYPGALDAVTLTEGTIDLTDGVAHGYTVGSLSLAGGATLAFDVIETATDAITATNGATLVGASAENPVRIALHASSVPAETWAEGLTLVSGGLSDGDAAKFALTDNLGMEELALSVVNGALVVKDENNTTPIVARWQQVEGTWQWVCYNAEGQALDDVTPREGVTTLSVESGTPLTCTTMPPCQRIVFNPSATSGRFELPADGDWSGLDLAKVQAGAKIDLMGHALKIPATGTADALTIYDSAVVKGTLRLEAAEDAMDARATGIAFDASVTAFEKLGAGEFAADARFDGKSVTVTAGTWSTADGAARIITYSALTFAGGTTLKVDATDEIRPAALTLNGTAENPIAVVTTGTAKFEDQPVLVNSSITPTDRAKFATDAALTVESGRVVHFTKILPEGYVMLPYVETLDNGSAAYVDTGIGKAIHVVHTSGSGSQYEDRPVLEATFMPITITGGNTYFGALNNSSTLGGSMALWLNSNRRFESIILNNLTNWRTAPDGKEVLDVTPTIGKKYIVSLRADLSRWGTTDIYDEFGEPLASRVYHNLQGQNTFLQSNIYIGRASNNTAKEWGAAARHYMVVLTFGVGSGRKTRTYYPALETATGRVGFYCTGAQTTFLPSVGANEFGYLHGYVAEGTLHVREGLLAPNYSYLNTSGSLGIGSFSALEKTGPNALRIKAGYTSALKAVNLAEGTLDFVDGARGTHKLGAVTLAGGTKIRMDVVNTTMSDEIEVSAPPAYVGVTVESPVEIVLEGGVNADLTLITGGQLTETDLPNFRIADECAKAGYVLRVKDGNLEYVNDSRPERMVWKDGAWKIQNAQGDDLSGIPADPLLTTVYMPTPAQSVTDPVEVKTIRAAEGSTIELGADTDWSGLPLDKFAAGLTIDLKGHDLTLKGNGASVTTAVTFTNSSETVATLTECVPQEKMQNNGTYKITGPIRVVKTGPGTLVLSPNATFTGGLVVREGSITSNNYGDGREFGASGGEITIGDGAEMQLGRMIKFHDYQFVLSNGTLKATGSNGVDAWESSYWNSPLVANVRLDGDATIDFSTKFYGFRNANHGSATLDLAGHTLDLTFTSGYIDNLTVTNGGTIRLKGGVIEVYNQGVGLSAPDTRFEMEADGTFQPRKDITIGDYICRVTKAVSWPNDTYCNKMFVKRTFKTYTEYFYGCTLLDGATLDLSNQTLAWSVKSKCGAGAGRDALTFADHATINIDLGSRKVRSGDLIVSWSTAKPANLATLKFVDPSGRNTYIATAEGLEVHRGFAFYVR